MFHSPLGLSTRLGLFSVLMAAATCPAQVVMPDGKNFSFWDDQTKYVKVYHVACENPAANDANDGSEAHPFATINRAAELLNPGEKVIVHKGVYRECVRPVRGGEGPDKMIAYEAAAGEEVWVKGSELCKVEAEKPAVRPMHRRHRGSRPAADVDVPPLMIWSARLPVEKFAAYNPFLVSNMARQFMWYNWAWTQEDFERFELRRGHVYFNGKPLRQVFDFAELRDSDNCFWVEPPGEVICFRLPGDADAVGATLEVSAREQALAPKTAKLGYIRVSGFRFCHAADGVPMPQRAMVSTRGGHHWIIENNLMEYANSIGLDIGRQDFARYLPEEEYCGGHIVRNNRIRECGVCGIAGAGFPQDVLIDGNIVENIGSLDIERNLESAGLKFHHARGALIRRNVFRHIDHAAGLWLDVDNVNCRITENVFADIRTVLGACYLECTHAKNVIDDNLFWNIRSDEKRDPVPDYVRHGGVGFDGDSCENLVIANNFFGRVADNYAVSLHLQQNARITHDGRVGLARRFHVVNNMFFACPNQILLATLTENVSDGNLFQETSRHSERAGLCLLYPEPKALMNLEGWRDYFRLDEHSTAAKIRAEFNPDTLVLTCRVEGPMPVCRVVEGVSRGNPPQPGPFDESQWKELLSGKTVTVSFPAGGQPGGK
jgi:hypothetical protein